MLIRCWGSRGSLPVSGKSYEKYGGDTTCIEVRPDDETIIIIDAGSGIRKLAKVLLEEKKQRYHLLMTHTHLDHVIGLLSFKPLFQSSTQLDVYGPDLAGISMEAIFKTLLAPPYSPITFSDIKADITFHNTNILPIQLGSTEIKTIPLSHPGSGCGYSLEYDRKKFVFLTDNELAWQHNPEVSYQDYVTFAQDADLLFHDAAYTENEYESRGKWGHSTYNIALKLAIDAGVKQFGLFHHCPGRKDGELDTIVEECNRACKEIGKSLYCFAAASETDCHI